MPNTTKYTPEQRKRAYDMYHEGKNPIDGKSQRGKYRLRDIEEATGVSKVMCHYIGNRER